MKKAKATGQKKSGSPKSTAKKDAASESRGDDGDDATVQEAGDDVDTKPARAGDVSEKTLPGLGGPPPAAPPEPLVEDNEPAPPGETGGDPDDQDEADEASEEFADEITQQRAVPGDALAGDAATVAASPDGGGDAMGDPVADAVAASTEATDGDPAAPAAPVDGDDDDTTPVPADNARLESVLESLLFAADKPLTVSDLKRLLGERDPKRLTTVLEGLRERRAESGIQLVSVAGGWQLRTHPTNGAWVAKLVAGRPQRLSRAMMETLAIVAYRQPITRPEIDEIRGVDCGPVLRTLLDRGLIRGLGKKEEVGRPILYGTTPEFLKTFSLRDLTELPTLREFHELGADDRAKVDSVTPAGEGAQATTSGPAANPGVDTLPSASELPTYDTSEEDALIDELDRASAAAGHAVRMPTAPEPESPEAEAQDAASAAAESGSAMGLDSDAE